MWEERGGVGGGKEGCGRREGVWEEEREDVGGGKEGCGRREGVWEEREGVEGEGGVMEKRMEGGGR